MKCMHLQHSRSHLECLTFELPKLRFRGHNYNIFDDFLKRLLTCILVEAGSVMGATPESMDIIFLNVKMTLNVRINITTLTSVLLEVARRGGLKHPSSPKSAIDDDPYGTSLI